jgi:hypothetical protein
MGMDITSVIPPGRKAITTSDQRLACVDDGHSFLYLNSYSVQAGNSVKVLWRRPEGNYEVKYLTASTSPGEVIFEVWGAVTIEEEGDPAFNPIPFNRNNDLALVVPPRMIIRNDVDYDGGIMVVSQRIDNDLSALSDSWEDRSFRASGLNPSDTVLEWKNLGAEATFINLCISWTEGEI